MVLRPRRALVVTDVTLLQWALSSAFGRAGFVALGAQSADAALDTLRTVDEIDLVVVSLSIGSTHAGDIVRICGGNWPPTPVILLGADPESGLLEREDGTRIFLLEEPFSVADVMALAEKLAPEGGDGLPPGGETMRADAAAIQPRRS